jgi:hypothetical protein
MLNNAHDAATNKGAAITSNRVSIKFSFITIKKYKK